MARCLKREQKKGERTEGSGKKYLDYSQGRFPKKIRCRNQAPIDAWGKKKTFQAESQRVPGYRA